MDEPPDLDATPVATPARARRAEVGLAHRAQRAAERVTSKTRLATLTPVGHGSIESQRQSLAPEGPVPRADVCPVPPDEDGVDGGDPSDHGRC